MTIEVDVACACGSCGDSKTGGKVDLGGWVYGTCVAVIHSGGQHLSICERCPCIHITLHTINVLTSTERMK
jgi:hypothetical protein